MASEAPIRKKTKKTAPKPKNGATPPTMAAIEPVIGEAEASKLAVAAVDAAPERAAHETIQHESTDHELKEPTMTEQTETPTLNAPQFDTAGYAKATEMTREAVALGQGNMEAMVESGRVMFAGLQDMGREAVETGRAAMEETTADFKKAASVKSPTELMQMQSEIARRNLDAMMGLASKNTEAMIKLASESFAPLSNRMSVAADKVAQPA